MRASRESTGTNFIKEREVQTKIKSSEINGIKYYAKPISLGGYNEIKRIGAALMSGVMAKANGDTKEAMNEAKFDIAKALEQMAAVANAKLLHGLCDATGKQKFKTVEQLENELIGDDLESLILLVHEANPSLAVTQTEAVEEAEKN